MCTPKCSHSASVSWQREACAIETITEGGSAEKAAVDVAARPQGRPSLRRAVITVTPEASAAMASAKSACRSTEPTLRPALEACAPVACDDSVEAVEAGVGVGVVASLVGAPALLPGQAGRRHRARQREGVLQQLGQPRGVALQAG